MIANANGIAFATFHCRGDRLPANGRLDDMLHLRNGHAVAGNGLAVDVNLQVGLADDAVGDHGIGINTGHFLEERLDGKADPLDVR